MNHKKEEEPKKQDPEKDQPQDELSKLTTECTQLRDKYVRMCADFDNARKRWDRDKEDLLKFANFSLLRDMVGTFDEIGHALKIAVQHKSYDEIVKGLEMTCKNFDGLLKKNAVEPIEALGKKFDPHQHEIMATKEIEGDDDHMVVEEVQKGYLCEGKVLRTSKVIVGIKKQTEEIAEEGGG